VALWLLDIIATRLQWRVWRIVPDNTALRTRLWTGLILTAAASAIAVTSLLHLIGVELTRNETDLFVLALFIVVSLPQVHWLWEWWRGFH
jgi:hypothetical protein